MLKKAIITAIFLWLIKLVLKLMTVICQSLHCIKILCTCKLHHKNLLY